MPEPRRLRHLLLALLLLLGLVAFSLFYWGVGRRDVLAREDNPRLVEAELRVQRGAIFDTNGNVLATSEVVDSAAFPPGRVRRLYPAADSGPAIGYYSFRHGTAGVEDGLDALLRGEMAPLERLRHEPQRGSDVRLTLNVLWQQEAERLLGDRQGAIILITLPDGAIRAMVSHPTYDPNLLDDQFEMLLDDASAPLLNRATQGLYQPGMTLAPLLLGASYERGLMRFATPVEEPDRPVPIDGVTRGCIQPPADAATYRDALHAVCPAPVVDLARQSWSSDEVADLWSAFGFYETTALPLESEAPAAGPIDDPGLSAIGQEGLTLSPLRLLLAYGTLGNEGRLPQPRLVEATRAWGGAWTPYAPERAAPTRPLSAEAAAATLAALPRFAGAAEYGVAVLSGPEGSENSWYVGLAPAGAPQYGVVVIVEGAQDRLVGSEIGRALLATVLE